MRYVIVPLLVVALIAATAVMGGPGQILDGVSAAAPSLLDLGHQPGVEFAVAVIVMEQNPSRSGWGSSLKPISTLVSMRG
jgi:hypothetical protein